MKFDELVSTYEQVEEIGKTLAYTFVESRGTNKVMVNMCDHFDTNNNFGFNLANFKAEFFQQYYDDIVSDYELSFVGSFARHLFKPARDTEIYMSLSKFHGTRGFNLTQNQDEVSSSLGDLNTIREEMPAKKAEILNIGAIPEFVWVSDLETIYKVLAEANLKNKYLMQSNAREEGLFLPSDE